MARRLAHTSSDSDGDRTDESDDEKVLLNRRRYVQMGAAAVTALVSGTAVGASQEDGGEAQETFSTDFSDGL